MIFSQIITLMIFSQIITLLKNRCTRWQFDSLATIWIVWLKSIGLIFKTALLTITADPHFWPISAEHDVTMTSYLAHPSEPRNEYSFGRDVWDWSNWRGMQSLVVTSAMHFGLLKDKWRGRLSLPPPLLQCAGRGLNGSKYQHNTMRQWLSFRFNQVLLHYPVCCSTAYNFHVFL